MLTGYDNCLDCLYYKKIRGDDFLIKNVHIRVFGSEDNLDKAWYVLLDSNRVFGCFDFDVYVVPYFMLRKLDRNNVLYEVL